MSAWAIPLGSLLGYVLTAAVITPIAMSSLAAESLILPVLVRHPLRRRRTRWTTAEACGRWVLAVALAVLGAGATAVFGLVATGRGEADVLELALWTLLPLCVAVLHARLTVQTARRGARLYGNHEAWKAKSREARNLWRVLTYRMPLRAWDGLWVALVTLISLLCTFAVFVRQERASDDPPTQVLQLTLYGSLLMVVFLSFGVLWLLDRAMPETTLARWAAYQNMNPAGPLRNPRRPLGSKVAPCLELRVRRLARQLPLSLRDDFLTTSSKLVEALRVAHIQQDTRQKMQVTMRHALQYGARLGNARDASETTRMVDTWLASQGLSNISAPQLRVRRRMPTVQGVNEVAEAVSKVKELVVGAIILAFAIGAGLSLDVLDKLK